MGDWMNVKSMEQAKDGRDLPAYAWPGGYPILYLDGQNEILCPLCATKAHNDKDEFQCNKPEVAFVYYEGPELECVDCGARFESAYGDPDEEETYNA
jgi:hypothetical protein